MKREWFRPFFDNAYTALLQDQWTPRQTREQVDCVMRLMRLKKGASVLDLACGYGRHTAELARRGFHVTGVDLSLAMIRAARKRFGQRPRARFLRGDMRTLSTRARYDAVICMFSSLGYFSPAGNLAVLRRMARAVKPGGAVLLDGRDGGWTRRNFVPRIWLDVGGGRYVVEEATLDRTHGVIESRWKILDVPRRRVIEKRLHLQQWDLAGYRRLFRQAGLRLDAWATGYDGKRAPGYDRQRLIVVGRKPGS